jgi:ParB family transcriptional regulator, chromosome partitioning protein
VELSQSKLEVAYRSSATLVPYERNARQHSGEQVAQVAASILEFGFTNPLLIDEHGTLIAGHCRLAAAHHLQLAEVPTITLHGLSDQQRRALTLADNKLALNASWDEALLTAELSELRGEGYDVGIVGFDADGSTRCSRRSTATLSWPTKTKCQSRRRCRCPGLATCGCWVAIACCAATAPRASRCAS